jgi:NADH dehydrogenase/NADH:ubiquinone oxidoreductase subunit G
MPQITINGKAFEFQKGERILQVALRNDVTIPHYCYHPSMSIPANCRICLAEVWAPNRAGKLEAMPGLKATSTAWSSTPTAQAASPTRRP